MVAEPAKRPQRAYGRFETRAPTELWQADGIEIAIAIGAVKIPSYLDDHSEGPLRVKAVPEVTSEATQAVFCGTHQTSGRRWGS